ncbi:hypothetical protein HYU22_03905 [Candidatus Woesearchaeota archaeon]|nr:hypothetical protein [Candidatus Woesearchaeota archaeon]
MELKNRLGLFAISLLATLIMLRTFLLFSPSSNLYIFGYNIHHLFIGSFLIVVLLVFLIFGILNNFTIILAGISSSLVLDEIVYLLATDGSDASYLSSASLFGAIILTTIILILAIVLYIKKHKPKE